MATVVFYAGLTHHHRPKFLYVLKRLSWNISGEKVWRVGLDPRNDGGNEVLCGPAKRNVLSLLLFRVMRRLCPNPSTEIKILPLGFQDLAHSGPCQQLESNGIARADIWVVLQYPDKARKLFVREPSVTLFLPIPLDPLGGVVSPPTPLDGQIEHFRD